MRSGGERARPHLLRAPAARTLVTALLLYPWLGAEVVIHNAPFDVGFLNHELSLLPREFKLLEELLRNRDKVVTRTMLLERV